MTLDLSVREVPFGPEDLPPVAPGQLELALDAAADAALAEASGPLAGVRFLRPDGPETRVMFTDFDARCWVAACDRLYGLETPPGLSICFRLLGLLTLMGSQAWLRPWFRVGEGQGLEAEPALLRAAASQRLTPDGEFDPMELERRLELTGRKLSGPAPAR